MEFKFTWVSAYAAIAQRLLQERNNQLGLIEVLRQIGADGFHDEDENGNTITLQEIDGFTFLCYLNKYGDLKRKQLLHSLCRLWQIDIDVKDVCGIPSVNPQRLRMFPFKASRINDEINRLWNFFQAILENTATNEGFADVLTIQNVGKQKITEVLFLIQPEECLCLNSIVKPYLEQTENIRCDVNSFSEYQELCRRIKNQLQKSFPLISYEAFLYSDFRDKPVQYFKIGSTAGNTGESLLPEMIPNNIVSIGWADLGNLEEMNPLNKSSIQTAMQQEGYYEGNLSTISRKAGEIFRFYKDIKPFDIVSVVQGASVKAIGRVNGHHYVFEKSLDFPHCKTVDWIDTNVSGLTIDEGPQTSVWQCAYPETIKKIQDYVNEIENKNIQKQKDQIEKHKNKDMFLNTILYGPPGTGKTYNSILRAAEIIEGRSFENKYDDAKAVFKKQIGDHVEFITFHQNYSYEDFVAGLRPDVDSPSVGIKFVEYKGIFYKLCERAKTNYKQHKSGQTYVEPSFEEVLEKFLEPLEIGDEIEVNTIARNVSFHITANNGKNLSFRKQSGGTGHKLSISTMKAMYEGRREYGMQGVGIYLWPVVEKLKEMARGMRQETGRVPLKNYVLIIDEINRANISKVFGELITLIEPDKRLGAKHELMLTLPGLPEDEKFSVPPNVYLLGTMNTADKSIALLDIALRRRFVFDAMYPNLDLVDSPYREFLQALNETILDKKGADFMIGHSYLMPDEISNTGFVNIMNQKIIPLLNEYFYNNRSISVFDLLKDIIAKAGSYEVMINPYKEVICQSPKP